MSLSMFGNSINGINGLDGLYLNCKTGEVTTGDVIAQIGTLLERYQKGEILQNQLIEDCYSVLGNAIPYFSNSALAMEPYIAQAFNIRTQNEADPNQNLWQVCIIPSNIDNFDPVHLGYENITDVFEYTSKVILLNSHDSQLDVTQMYRLFVQRYGEEISFHSFMSQFITVPLNLNADNTEFDRVTFLEYKDLTTRIGNSDVPQVYLLPGSGIVTSLRGDGNLIFTVNGEPPVSPPYIGQEGPYNFSFYNFLSIYSNSLVPATTDVTSPNLHLKTTDNGPLAIIFAAVTIASILGLGFLKWSDLIDFLKGQYGKKQVGGQATADTK